MRVTASSICLFAFALLVFVSSVTSEGQALNTAGATSTRSNASEPKQLKANDRAGTTVPPRSRWVTSGSPEALCPIVFVGASLLVVAGIGFGAAAKVEAATRSAIYIAKSAHATLLSGLAVLIIYAVSVAVVVLFR